MQADTLLIGGGNARHLVNVLDLAATAGTRLGSNADAFRGGVRLWHPRPRQGDDNRAEMTGFGALALD